MGNSTLKKIHLEGKEMVTRKHISLSESDLEIAKVLGNGSITGGIREALRRCIKFDQVVFEL